MAQSNGTNTSSQNWTSTQAYIMAVISLLGGCAVGYLLRGSASTTPAPAQQAQQAPAGMGGMGGGMGMGQQQMPTPEQLKAMADKQAAPLLEQLKSKPNDPALLAQIGNMYYDAQQFPTAIDYYNKSLAANPKDANVRTDLGTSYFYSNQPDKALEELDKVLKDTPNHANALFDRGIVKWQAKMDAKGAVADWEQLLKTNPNWEGAEKVKMYIAQAQKHMNMKPGQKTDKPAM
ncbi:MAG TPA: tetratricopeptide repeat protein [Candidatus Acidoferrales bacterium]|nr:tetratricopeptide repeat protein [Candidatus Acidoferrales bacterium]